MGNLMRHFLFIVALCFANLALAQSLEPRDGWVVLPSDKPFDVLLDDVKAAVKANGMAVVTQAGPTGAAARRGITIPNNRVVGVFNNLFAVRILNLSTAAMIEAPIRLYVTEFWLQRKSSTLCFWRLPPPRNNVVSRYD